MDGTEPGAGGRGGRGGQGGKGGASDVAEGAPGSPGEPGEPGEKAKIRYFSGPISIASLATVILAIISGIVWVVDLKGNLRTEINSVSMSLANLDENIKSLNTPLSQRVFSAEARINEIARIQSDMRLHVDSIDKNGTTQNQILTKDVASLRADVSGQNSRCQEANRRIDELQREGMETKLRLQYLIEALSPHDKRK